MRRFLPRPSRALEVARGILAKAPPGPLCCRLPGLQCGPTALSPVPRPIEGRQASRLLRAEIVDVRSGPCIAPFGTSRTQTLRFRLATGNGLVTKNRRETAMASLCSWELCQGRTVRLTSAALAAAPAMTIEGWASLTSSEFAPTASAPLPPAARRRRRRASLLRAWS
jgi:hypothetical protein